MSKQIGWLALAGYVASIVAANWLLVTFGFIPVWPGIVAPAGVLAVGVSLSLRDAVQETLGRKWTAGAILVGACLSALISPQFALASGAAFLLLAFGSLDYLLGQVLGKWEVTLATVAALWLYRALRGNRAAASLRSNWDRGATEGKPAPGATADARQW